MPGVCGLTAADALLESAVSTFWKSFPEFDVCSVRFAPWSTADCRFGDYRDAHTESRCGLMHPAAALKALEGILADDAMRGAPRGKHSAFAICLRRRGEALQSTRAPSRRQSAAQRVEAAGADAASRSEVEAAIREAVEALVGVADISESEPLMDQGMTSSSAVALSTELEEILQREGIPATLVFDCVSLSGIFEYVRELEGIDDDGELSSV